MPCNQSVSRSVVPDSLWRHGLQPARLPCPSPTAGACSKSCSSSQWYYPTISSSVIPFSFCLQSFPESGSFQMSQLFASGGQSIGVSASADEWMFRTSNEYSGLISFRIDWFDLLAVQGISRVFSSTTVQKHQFFGYIFIYTCICICYIDFVLYFYGHILYCQKLFWLIFF